MKVAVLVVVAAGAMALSGCDDEVTGPEATGDVYVVHGINGTDIGASEALPLDVVVNGSPAFENVPNGASGTPTLDPNTYEVTIQTPDNQTTAFNDSLQLDAGTLYAAYAVGSVENETFEVLLQTLSF